MNNIVLREDQKEYIKAKQHQRRQKALDMFDPDFIPLAGKVGDHLRIGNNMYGTDIIGYGRRNPNVVRKKGTRKKWGNKKIIDLLQAVYISFLFASIPLAYFSPSVCLSCCCSIL